MKPCACVTLGTEPTALWEPFFGIWILMLPQAKSHPLPVKEPRELSLFQATPRPAPQGEGSVGKNVFLTSVSGISSLSPRIQTRLWRPPCTRERRSKTNACYLELPPVFYRPKLSLAFQPWELATAFSRDSPAFHFPDNDTS